MEEEYRKKVAARMLELKIVDDPEPSAAVPVLVVCGKQLDGPANVSSITEVCGECKEKVWMSLGTVTGVHKINQQKQIICLDCWMKRMDAGQKMVMVRPLEDQIPELPELPD